MNIVTPLHVDFHSHNANVGSDGVRKDNAAKNTIPPIDSSAKADIQTKYNSESGFNKSVVDAVSNVYQKPSLNKNNIDLPPSAKSQTDNTILKKDPERGVDTVDSIKVGQVGEKSVGVSSSEKKIDKEQEQQEQKKVAELKARDKEVRVHEQAHAAVGGQYAGSPQYEFETGPDDKRYVVNGEVSIDVSEANTAEETIRKMDQVRAAALAPAEPSAQDLKVASEASQKSNRARAEVAKEGIDNTTSETSHGSKLLQDNDKETNDVVSSFYTSAITPKASQFSISA